MEMLSALRKELHKFPELSGQEEQTSQRILSFLKECGPSSIIENVGGYGILAFYDSGHPGHCLAFRCELDALPICEKKDFPYSSINEGVAHKCGHDGHMAIMAGLAYELMKNPLKRGQVILIFQPAEENGKGAKAMLQSPVFSGMHIDHIYSIHNLPEFPMHQVLWKDNPFNATVISVAIAFRGVTSHASEPQKGINPSRAIHKCSLDILDLSIPDPKDMNFALITPVHTHIGSKDYGISPGYGEMHFTMRTWNQKNMDQLIISTEEMANKHAQKHDLECKIEYSDYFPGVNVDQESLNTIIQASKDSNLSCIKLNDPIPFGEDFGFFTQKYKGAMVGLGSGINTPPLHHEAYDFPDELIETGVQLFNTIIKNHQLL
jgi:amidohydrolase